MAVAVEPDQVFEASDLGYPPGFWPRHSEYGAMVRVEKNEGDILYVDYMNHDKEILTRIFND
jgi:hypothetical protein